MRTPGMVFKPADEPVHQLVLVVVNHAPGGFEPFTPAGLGRRTAVGDAEAGDVVDGRCGARHALVVLGAGLPFAGQLFACRAHAIGPQPLQVLALAVQEAGVGTKELVGAAGQEVAVQLLSHRSGRAGHIARRR